MESNFANNSSWLDWFYSFWYKVILHPRSKLTKSITNPCFCAGTAPGWSFPGSWLGNMTSLRCGPSTCFTQHHIIHFKKGFYCRRSFIRCSLLSQQIMIHAIEDFSILSFLAFYLTWNQKLWATMSKDLAFAGCGQWRGELPTLLVDLNLSNNNNGMWRVLIWQ